jgi:hypothetical protein
MRKKSVLKRMMKKSKKCSAIRNHGRGSQSIGLLMQIDLERYPGKDSESSDEGFWKRNWDTLVRSLD